MNRKPTRKRKKDPTLTTSSGNIEKNTVSTTPTGPRYPETVFIADVPTPVIVVTESLMDLTGDVTKDIPPLRAECRELTELG